MNSLTHTIITTKTSFPALVSHGQMEQAPPLVRSFYRPPTKARTIPRIAVDNKTGGGKGMGWFYELEEEVREYELDQFGVVNNAVYSNYCEYGTYKLLDMIGFDENTKLAVTEVAAKYIAPLKRKDRYLIKLRIYDHSTTRLYFENQICKLPNQEPILRGTCTLVLLDEELRPCRIPPSMISKFNQYTCHAKIKY